MYTTSRLARSDREEKIGDLVLLPAHVSHVPKLWQIARQRIESLNDKVQPRLDVGLLRSHMIFEAIYSAYQDHRFDTNTEPGWVEELPWEARCELRRNFVTQEEAGQIVGYLPYTGVSYMLLDGGFVHQTEIAFVLRRLRGIRQLGYLDDPSRWRGIEVESFFEHSRYVHSLDVFALATLIGTNCRLSASELKVLQVAALTHDVLTPAGGDSIKNIDSAAFDEDARYADALTPAACKHLTKWHIDSAGVILTVQGQGVLGKILDIADKASYLARDLAAFVPKAEYNEHYELSFLDLNRRVQTNRLVCGAWDSVRVVRGQVAFSDAERLLDFLMVRVLMFRDFYYNPRARFGEFLASQVLAGGLYRNGKLTRTELLEMDDFALERRLSQEYGVAYIVNVCCRDAQPAREPFETRAQADLFAQRLVEQGNPFVLVEEPRRHIKPGADLLVVKGNKVMSLKKAMPQEAEQLEREARLPYAATVYYFQNLDALPKPLVKRLVDERRAIQATV